MPRVGQRRGGGQPLPEVGLRRRLVTPFNHLTTGRVRRAGRKCHQLSAGFKKIVCEKSFGTAGQTPRQRGSSGEGEEEEEEAKTPLPALDPGSQKRLPTVSFSLLLNVCPTFPLV